MFQYFCTFQVALLVMCAGLFSEQVQFFLGSATTLDNRIQHDIKHMVEYVVQPNNSLRGLDSSFYRVLNLPFGMCPFLNSMKLVIPLHSLYWSIHTKDESKRGTAFAFIFGVN